MLYALPNTAGATVEFKRRYDNFIGGKFVPPVEGQYFDVITPITGKPYTQAARSSAADVELALDAAHAAAEAWGRTSPGERSNILLKIADRIEANLEKLAYAETVDNGKPMRETLNADVPLAVDHFRYFAGCLRSQEGSISEIDEHTIAYHFHEPLGVVGQIIPWNFPLLMAAWKLAPALGAGNCVVLKPAESTPVSIMVFAELIADLLPPGVLNIVNGYGREAGMPLASSKRIAKIAFTGSTATGRVIAQAAAGNLIPATLELGGKSPNIFFEDVAAADDEFFDKAIEGLVLFAFNQGEVCTCPSRALIHENIYDRFMARAIERVKQIKQGSPLDTETMMGAQASAMQMDKILGYLEIGRQEGAECLIGGARFLNVEDADELREERPKLAPSAVACVLVGLFLLVLAVGPLFDGAREVAAVAAAACIAGLVIITIRMRGSADELARQISLESSALTLQMGMLVLGAWAVLAQFGYAEWITPLALISGLAMLQLVAVFAICGVKGMLTPR